LLNAVEVNETFPFSFDVPWSTQALGSLPASLTVQGGVGLTGISHLWPRAIATLADFGFLGLVNFSIETKYLDKR